ncbi:SPX domain-containing protein [Epithele typhae]|uniref:SPX domain-containing protein n=1 Tax=Epithele typhae TaxID=378194 RepID=UPI0020081CA1|nr:SPX domain-containing protein [Epithele typhae]KAH9918924.1 SPX domain-containing protein [Epithele typhae]
MESNHHTPALAEGSGDIVSGEECRRLREHFTNNPGRDIVGHLDDPFSRAVYQGDLDTLQIDLFPVMLCRHTDRGLAPETARAHVADEIYQRRWGVTWRIPIFALVQMSSLLNPPKREQHLRIARWLIDDVRVPVDGRDPRTGATALLLAVGLKPRFDAALADMLYAAGADVNARDRYGDTCAHKVSQPDGDYDRDRVERLGAALRWVLTHGGNLDVADSDGETARTNLAHLVALGLPEAAELAAIVGEDDRRRMARKGKICVCCGLKPRDGSRLKVAGSSPQDIPLQPLERSNPIDLSRFAMKFSSSLKFNSVSEWWDEYIAYEQLKKQIYLFEKQQAGLRESFHDIEAANEHTSLIGSGHPASSDAQFLPLLDRELDKICMFYDMEEQRLTDDVTALQDEIEREEESGPYGGFRYMDAAEDDDDEDDDDFEATSPIDSRDRTQSPARKKRQHSRSISGTMPPGPSSGRKRYDSISRRYSMSSDEQEDVEASHATLDPIANGEQTGIGRGASRSPLVRARVMAARLKDSLISTVSSNGPETVWTARNNYAWDTQLLYKRKITNLYVLATSLRSYVELNYSGFRKILKKYDKVTDSNLQDRYLHDVVEQAKPFMQDSKDKLSTRISTLLDLYARCVTHGDEVEARRQLKLHQREHIAWERDTVWRQMINQARRGEELGQVPLGGTLIAEPEKGLTHFRTPFGRVKLTSKKLCLVIAVVIFLVLLNVQIVDGVEANKCLAILVFATILWATEAIPLFVTSTMIPFFLVVLRVIRSADSADQPNKPLEPPVAAKHVFSVMFSPTIMLLIGGFTIASALSKTAIDRVLITRVLSLAGERPSTVLLAFMGVACFASMWISNVAAPTLCFTLIQACLPSTPPILRTLPPKSSFAPCLILGIALAANIGGQSSPISSPQNLIALAQMDPKLDWGSWFAVSIPVSAISIVLIWLLLLVSYRPARSPTGDGEIVIKPVRAPKERFNGKQWWVTFVCLITIGLWCVAHSIEGVLGDMGVIAIIPIVAFFSTGVLKKDDFEQFLWTVVFIAMGGIALGDGVRNSGLLEVLGDGIRGLITGMSLYPVVLLLSVIVLVISTFISHTIASVLLVPIAFDVGRNMPDGDHANLLVFLTGLICSTGMGMPVSGFPNQTAATQEDEMGQLYLSNVDFLKNGVPASIIATFVVSTVGYLLMRAIKLELEIDVGGTRAAAGGIAVPGGSLWMFGEGERTRTG